MNTFLLALGLLATPAFAGPIEILDCSLGYAPIQRASFYAYMGQIRVLTISEGGWSSEFVPEQDFDRRIITLVDNTELKGVLYFSEDRWRYTFKTHDGWRMMGDAQCRIP